MTCGGDITIKMLRRILAQSRGLLRESELIADAIESKSPRLRAEVRRRPAPSMDSSRWFDSISTCLLWDFSTRHDRLLEATTRTIAQAMFWSGAESPPEGFSTKEIAARLGLDAAIPAEAALNIAAEAASEAVSDAARTEDFDRYLDEKEWFEPPLPATKRLRRWIANYGPFHALFIATVALPPLAALLVWLAA